MTIRLRRTIIILAALATAAALLPLLPGEPEPADAAPTASDMTAYQACGRVFADPQAYWPSPSQAPSKSPWAKGNATCQAQDFIAWQGALQGLNFLASDAVFGDFVEVYNLGDEDDGLDSTREGEFDDVLDKATGEGRSAGLPTSSLDRDKQPLYLVRVTDEADQTVPIGEREHFVYSLSIHGNERAGVEGGLRAVEDLATWASCEKHGDEDSAANCAQENAGPDNPHPILETIPDESVTAGEALKRSSVWFTLSNPDGWRRGDKQKPGYFYQRYNGNGMDLNRDWPSRGFTYRPYTPFSEPESRSFAKTLKDIKDQWTGGIDLHGQLVANSFSYTLLGGSERPYGKDRRVLQFVKGAYRDAEQRLAWSSLIKPNDAPADDPRVYGVQWGTIWDTINYTVTGAMGDWFDSPMGLNADGIDNEMSLSHVSNCGTGNCFVPEVEQLHVDGNKSLIYGMIHFSLKPEDQTFRYDGKVGYLHNPRKIADPGAPPAQTDQFGDLPAQEDIPDQSANHDGQRTDIPFEVKGPEQEVYNAGLTAKVTFSNVEGVSGEFVSNAGEVAIDRQLPKDREDDDPNDAGGDEGWEEMNSYFNQDGLYAQAGARVDVNAPPPGPYRVRVSGGDAPAQVDADILFKEDVAWPDPGQQAFEATNMGFFDMLKKFVTTPDKLERVSVDKVLSGETDLRRFDTIVAADDAFLPGYRAPGEILAPTAQETNSGTVVVPAPAAGERNEATTVNYEFDVEAGNASLTGLAELQVPGDVDLFLQKQKADGSWSGDLASGTQFVAPSESLSYKFPQPGHYRIQVVNFASPPQTADMTVTFFNEKGESGPGSEARFEVPIDTRPDDNIDTRVTKYDNADRDKMASTITSFAEQGGNVVLTDDSLRALEWMGLVPEDAARKAAVYAGHVQFQYTNDAGETVVTYDDPLAANVDQPGSAEGPNHRHQTSEPVPLGYAIQDLNGGDFSSMPEWGISREAWDQTGGRIAGTLGTGDVTLGEIEVGDGRVRVLGSLLQFPTDAYDHPFGVEDYALTYTGYELFNNLVDWTNPNGRLVPPIEAGCKAQVPDSGFTDIAGNTHESNIECIAWYEITQGTTETSYSPATAIPRAQIASYLAHLASEGGLDLPGDAPDAFEDDEDSVHQNNINALAAAGLVEGTGDADGDGTPEFSPGTRVSREQMASLVARVHERVTGSLPQPSRDHFDDDGSSEHHDAINALAELGVIQGRQDTEDADGDGDTDERLFFPTNPVPRDQMATFIIHDLGLLVDAGEAHFGGATVTLEATETSPGGELSGAVASNKQLAGLTADGCGLGGEEVAVGQDGAFTVTIGDDQSGQCELALTTASRRVHDPGDGQTVTHSFGITVSES